MSSRTIEAKFVISGQDQGASAAIAKVVDAVRKMEDASRVSKPLLEVARNLQQVEQASRAVDAALKARTGTAAAEAGLKATRDAAAAAAKALTDAKTARAAFDGVKAAAGSEQARQIEATTKAVRSASDAYRKAENDVRRATAAVAAQTSTLEQAERAAKALGADLGGLEAHQQRLRVAYDASTAAITRQIAAEERAARVGATMGASGRAQLNRIESGRRVADGMSAPGRALAVERQRAVEASAASAALRAQGQREARDVAAGVAGAAAGSALRGAYVKARDGWIEMDEASRRQKAVLSLTDEKQVPLNAQALKIGQDTRFSNPDVVKAQTRIGSSLPDHLKDAKVITAITENAKDYALAMGTTMDEASSALLGRMLGLRMDMATPDATAASAKHAANRLVQFAKSSGADHNDLMHYTKFGAAPGSVGGFSEEFSDAMAAQLRRIGYEGAMAGNFVRSAATRLSVPTAKGLGALAAAGIDHSDYVTPGKELSADNLDSVLKLKFGKGLSKSQIGRIAALMDDEEVVGNREEFVPKVSAIIQETLAKRTKAGKVNANDAERIAKTVNEYLSASAGAVDIQRLMRDLVARGLTPALAKYVFGSEHGGRAQALDVKTLDKDVEAFRNTPQDRAQKIGQDINAGSYGAYQRMVGSIETFWMKLGQVNDGPLTKFYDTVGNAVDAVSNMPKSALQAGTALGGVAGAAIIARGALGAFRLGRDLLGFGGSAAALTKSAGLLDAAAIKLMGGTPGATPNKVTDAVKAVPLAGFGLGGVVVGLGAGAAVAGVATADQLPKIAEKEGPGAIDPATGEKIETEIPRTTPWLRNWLTGKAAEDAGKAIGAEVGKGIVAVPLPPPRPDAFRPITERAGEAGTQAGQKVGQGVADGVQEKAPEVEAQGKTLWQRLKDAMANPIYVPISFAPGEGMGGGGSGGGGLIQRASFGGGGGGISGGSDGSVRRASLGGGGGGDGPPPGAGGSGRITGPLAKAPTEGLRGDVRAYVRAAAIARGIDPNVAERVVNQESGFNPHRNNITSKEHSYGVMQLNTMGGLGAVALRKGLNPRDPSQWRKHIDFGLDVVKRDGWRQWYGARDVGISRWQGIGRAPPDGLKIPEPPSGGFGEGRQAMGAAADKILAAAERMEGMGFHGTVSLAVTGSGRDRVRATGMRVRGRGGMSADMGVSMPGAKESDDDWA